MLREILYGSQAAFFWMWARAVVVSGQLGLSLSSLAKSTGCYNYPRFPLFSSSCCNVHLHCPLFFYLTSTWQSPFCSFFSCGRKFSQLLARTSFRSRRQCSLAWLNPNAWSLSVTSKQRPLLLTSKGCMLQTWQTGGHDTQYSYRSGFEALKFLHRDILSDNNQDWGGLFGNT